MLIISTDLEVSLVYSVGKKTITKYSIWNNLISHQNNDCILLVRVCNR